MLPWPKFGHLTYQREFEAIATKFSNHDSVRLIMKYDESLSHRIYAATDMFVVPSIFEPCGLTQVLLHLKVLDYWFILFSQYDSSQAIVWSSFIELVAVKKFTVVPQPLCSFVTFKPRYQSLFTYLVFMVGSLFCMLFTWSDDSNEIRISTYCKKNRWTQWQVF